MPQALESQEKVPLLQKLQVLLLKQQQLHFLPTARESVLEEEKRKQKTEVTTMDSEGRVRRCTHMIKY